MAEQPVACPHCGKGYRWQSRIAGRKVRCGCGQKFRVPMTAGGRAVAVGPPPPPTPPPPAPSTTPDEPPIQLVDDTPPPPPSSPPPAPPPPPPPPRRDFGEVDNPIRLVDDSPPKVSADEVDEAGYSDPQADPPPADDASEDVGYELDLPEELSAAAHADARTRETLARVRPANGKCPSCNSPLRPAAVICLNCGFNLLEGAKIQTRVGDPEPGPQPPDGAGARRPRCPWPWRGRA